MFMVNCDLAIKSKAILSACRNVNSARGLSIHIDTCELTNELDHLLNRYHRYLDFSGRKSRSKRCSKQVIDMKRFDCYFYSILCIPFQQASCRSAFHSNPWNNEPARAAELPKYWTIPVSGVLHPGNGGHPPPFGIYPRKLLRARGSAAG